MCSWLLSPPVSIVVFLVPGGRTAALRGPPGPDGFWMDCFMTVSPLIFAAKVAGEDREERGGSYRGGGAIKVTVKRQ